MSSPSTQLLLYGECNKIGVAVAQNTEWQQKSGSRSNAEVSRPLRLFIERNSLQTSRLGENGTPVDFM